MLLRSQSTPVFLVIALITIAAAMLVSGSASEERISVYSSLANYSLSVTQRNNLDYVGLLELLEPLGTVSAKTSGDHWKFRFDDSESEFVSDKTQCQVHGSGLTLPANFLLENGRGLVPVSSLNTLLPRLLGGPIAFNQTSRRLFIGNVAVHFTAQVTNGALVMNFSSPVNPTIATEPGKLRMTFTHEPLVAPGSQTLTFDSKSIPAASFQENNGTAEVVVSSSVPVMATFSNDGRTITIAPPSSGPLPTAAQAPAQPASPAAPAIIASTSAPVASNQRVFAVIDPAHGGDERGAALSDQLAEKDVTLAFARALRTELTTRGLSSLLLRDGDQTIGLDQRAAMTNSSGAAIYICVHATSEGTGARLYNSLLPSGAENHGSLIDWDEAQSPVEATAQTAEAGIATELRNKQVSVRTFLAPLRPLNNVTIPAVAIEVSPAGGNLAQLMSYDYQQLIASAVAAGIAADRDKLQAGQR